MKYTRKDSSTERAGDRRPTPNVPIHARTLPFDRWAEGERFAGGDIPLGDLGGCTRIGVGLVELTPGKQSCPFHWHLKEEEHFFVLEGRCVLRTSEGRFEMGPGDYVCFPPSTRIAHCFENPFEAPCRMLVVGNRDEDEIAVYPDSGKAKLRQLGVIIPYTEGASLDYWQGERPNEPLPPKS